MNEYGIFQSIVEGDQAEAYKKRKKDEKDTAFKANRERENRRAKADSSNSGSADDALRKSKAEYQTRSHMKKTGRDSYGDYVSGKDAANRHIRRHPELNESASKYGIFQSVIEGDSSSWKDNDDDPPEQFMSQKEPNGGSIEDLMDESSTKFI